MVLIVAVLDGELLIRIIFIIDSFPHHVPSKDIDHLFPLQVVALVLFDLVQLLLCEIIEDIHSALTLINTFSSAA